MTYHWSPGEAPPQIGAHSLAKHDVLRQYLTTYVEVLTANVAVPAFRLTLVDGFAGGGLYLGPDRSVHDGSPLLMLEAMREASALAQSKRRNQFVLDVHYYFVEPNDETRAFLETTLRGRGLGDRLGADITLLGGDFAAHADAIIRRIKARRAGCRALFLLDQYGYSDVPLPLLRRIFSQLSNAEVLLTFSTDSLIDYMSRSEAYRRGLRRAGLHEFEEQLDSILALPGRQGERRRIAQCTLHDALRRGSGARHFTPFFIVSEEAHRAYWFVHLSNHARARDEMTKLHWTIQNRFRHYAGAGLSMLGYRPAADETLTNQVAFAFDDDARQRTSVALLRDIPAAIERYGERGSTFDTFMTDISNGTPAARSQIVDAISRLSREGALEVISANGQVRRKGVKARPTDLIRLHRQLGLF